MKDDGAVKFSYNWNNKLNCNSFTTIRRYNPDKYCTGKVHQVMMKTRGRWNTDFGKAEIIDVKCLTLRQIASNEYVCRLDTGYSAKKTEDILKKMHKGINKDSLFSFVLYSKLY